MKRPLPFAILLFVSTFVAGEAPAQSLAGYVVSIEGEASQAKLLRGGDEGRRLRLGENILAGDTVTAPATARIRIDTRSGTVDPCQPVPIAGQCRMHFPTEAGGVPGAAIAGRISTMLSWYAAPSRNLTTRAATPPVISIGKGAPQKLVAGRRSLRIAWNDGLPPFSVSVVAAGATISSARLSEREIRLPATEFRVGSAQIIVEDAQARRAAMQLTILGSGPTINDPGSSAVNAQHRVLLELGAIAAAEQGAWLLEALQRVEQLGASPVGEAFERALLSGGKP